MSQFRHGVLDEDGLCVMGGLEPSMCGGCRGHEPPPARGPGRPASRDVPTWDEFLDAEATREDLEPLDGLDRLDRQPDYPGGHRTYEERRDAVAAFEHEHGPVDPARPRRVP